MDELLILSFILFCVLKTGRPTTPDYILELLKNRIKVKDNFRCKLELFYIDFKH
jgi:hypothetical protein